MAQKRIMIWCNPRARSTVFELSIASVPSFKAYHEEYVIAAMMGEEREPGPFASFPVLPGYAYRDVKKRLEADYDGYEAVIIKDVVAMAVPHGDFRYLPDGYTHTFILREPSVSYLSFYNISLKLRDKGLLEESAIDFTLRVCPFQPLYDLYKELVAEGKKIIVISSDDLAANPREVLQKYCKDVEIPFYESMINWKPNNIGFWHDIHASDYFSFIYQDAIKSSCYLPPSGKKRETSELPPELQKMVEIDTPMFNEMIKHKI